MRSLVASTLAALVLSAGSAVADEPADREALLKRFVEEFVEITPGKGKFPKSFRMGSQDGSPAERPVHEVEFDYSFAIAKYEVPQNLYAAVMGSNPSRWKGPRNSVEMVSWNDARDFCARVTRMLREAKLIGPNEEIRLPTEAEWEFCCRAGTNTAYSFGDAARKPGDEGKQASKLDPYAWHTGNAAGNDPPVGALKPNPWGLYDVHGYLWEFVQDEWHPNYTEAPGNGSAWTTTKDAERRVIRGGSWKDLYDDLRSASRRAVGVKDEDDAIGFRCVRARVPARKTD